MFIDHKRQMLLQVVLPKLFSVGKGSHRGPQCGWALNSPPSLPPKKCVPRLTDWLTVGLSSRCLAEGNRTYGEKKARSHRKFVCCWCLTSYPCSIPPRWGAVFVGGWGMGTPPPSKNSSLYHYIQNTQRNKTYLKNHLAHILMNNKGWR